MHNITNVDRQDGLAQAWRCAPEPNSDERNWRKADFWGIVRSSDKLDETIQRGAEVLSV